MAPRGRATRARADADGDVKAAIFKALGNAMMASALGFVIGRVCELDNVRQWFMKGTALQQALDIYIVLFQWSLLVFSISTFAVIFHHVPRRFKGPRMIMGFLCFLCLCGAIYYGIYVTSTSGLQVGKYASIL